MNDPLDTSWEQDSDWPMCDWISEVQAGDTRLGYEEWVWHQKESELEDPIKRLEQLKANGLKFADCVAVFGDPSSEWQERAQNHPLVEEGTLEVDSDLIVSEPDTDDVQGVYVMAWLWVPAEKATGENR